MQPRFHVGSQLPLHIGTVCVLPEAASRHVQVLRLQPDDQIQLFDGEGAEYVARIVEMGRKLVTVAIQALVRVDRELPIKVVLALGMPANDRMDDLVEKATELGVYAIQPLMCERSVLRLEGERAAKKVAHWQAVAASASEQCGRAVVPQVRSVMSLSNWLKQSEEREGDAWRRGVLSLREAIMLREWLGAPNGQDAPSPAASANEADSKRFVFLSGPEGGLSPGEEQAALDAGWAAITLGSRVLRADTAPLAALSVLGAMFEQVSTAR